MSFVRHNRMLPISSVCAIEITCCIVFTCSFLPNDMKLTLKDTLQKLDISRGLAPACSAFNSSTGQRPASYYHGVVSFVRPSVRRSVRVCMRL